MSHIETGNTKLSLSVFADIVSALSVQTDELLYDILQFNKTNIKQELITGRIANTAVCQGVVE